MQSLATLRQKLAELDRRLTELERERTAVVNEIDSRGRPPAKHQAALFMVERIKTLP